MTATSRMAIALLCPFFVVLLPFLHVYANNVTNVQLPMSGFATEIFWLSSLCFMSIWLLLKLLPQKIESILAILLGIINVALWLQINFFIGHYGFLDGGEPEWEANFTLGITQVVSFSIIALVFFKFRKIVIDNLIFGAAVLVVSSLVYVPELLEAANKPQHKKYTFTKDGIFEFSSKRNVIIFVVDTLQADLVNEIFHELSNISEKFSGFTFFRNSLSSFPKTYASIPALLSGRPFDNTQILSEYLQSTYILDSLPAYLKKNDFDVRHWSSSPQSLVAHPFVSDNVADTEGRATDKSTIGIEDKELLTNMVLFRLAPHFLKPWVYNDGLFRLELDDPDLTLDNNICHLKQADRAYSRDIKSFDTVLADEFELCTTITGEQMVYRFFHLYGAHAPYRFDKNFHFIGNQPLSRKNFKAQTIGSLQLVSKMLRRIKALGIYDNSTILVISDHGEGEYWIGLNNNQPGLPPALETNSEFGEQIVRGAIPLILVKPANSDHPFEINDAPVELADIPATVLSDLGHNPQQFPGLPMYSIAPDLDRTRYHKYYQFSGWNIDYLLPMTEYEVDGFSWYKSSWRDSPVDLNANAQSHFDGTLVTLQERGNMDSFRHSGWSKPGRIGRTIKDSQASLYLNYHDEKSTLLGIVHYLYEDQRHNEEVMNVLVGEEQIGSWTFRLNDGQRKKFLLLSAEQTSALATSPLQFQLAQTGCKTIIREIRLISPDRYAYKPGSQISFKNTGNSRQYRTYGWSRTEFWGTPSIGKESGIFLNLGDEFPEKLALNFKARGYVYDNWPQQQVSIIVNGSLLETLTITDKKENSYQIPLSPMSGDKGILDITFRYPDAVRLSDLGISGDTRLQTIAMINLHVSPL